MEVMRVEVMEAVLEEGVRGLCRCEAKCEANGPVRCW